MPDKTIDELLFKPFITAPQDCLVKMAGISPVQQRIFVKNNPEMYGYVTGIIGITKGMRGNISVSFPLELAKKIVARLLREAANEITMEMVADGIGEVANMVAGGAKRLLASTQHRFEISTPTIIIGFPACLYNPTDILSIACEFSLPDLGTEGFMIEVALKPSINAQTPDIV
jgi:chemotaxis protein CheX